MKGKRLINANHLHHQPNPNKISHLKSTNKRELQEIRSTEAKIKQQDNQQPR